MQSDSKAITVTGRNGSLLYLCKAGPPNRQNDDKLCKVLDPPPHVMANDLYAALLGDKAWLDMSVQNADSSIPTLLPMSSGTEQPRKNRSGFASPNFQKFGLPHGTGKHECASHQHCTYRGALRLY